MKEIPILFSTEMVQTILAGRKTQTRRVVKLKHLPNHDIASIQKDGSGKGWIAWTPRAVSAEETKLTYPGEDGFKCRYGLPGDILWVRESWFPAAINGDKVLVGYHDKDPDNTREFATEKIDFYQKQMDKARMIPSIHMPKEAARIWLEVADIRVERVQDISVEDAIAEGVEKRPGSDSSTRFDFRHYHFDHSYDVDAKVSFRTLWQSINDPETWEKNVWVWVVSFKVLSTTGKPELKIASAIP